MVRKRSFETLEDRRLLAGAAGAAASDLAAPLVGPPGPQSVPAEVSPAAANSPAATSPAESDGDSADNSVENTPSAATQNMAASGDPAAANAAGPSATAEAPDEYASSIGGPADRSSAAADYASTSSNRRYYNDYASEAYSTPYSTTSSTSAQTTAIQSLAAALGEQPPGVQLKAQGEGPGSVNPALVAAPASGAATAGAARWSPSDLVVRSEMQPPLAIAAPSTPAQLGAADELAAPIALIAPAGDGLPQLPNEPATAWAFRFASDAATVAPSQLAELLAGPAAANLALIEQGVDALFERLDRLGGELAEKIGPRQCAHALLVAAGAAAAWEYARAWYRENEARPTADGRGPSELRLRRRWSLRRRGNL